eukprot:COSAG04_NODE_2820_length_3535_cov_4.592549_1_plen_134_part_10
MLWLGSPCAATLAQMERLQHIHSHIVSSRPAAAATSFTKCLIANRGEIAIRALCLPLSRAAAARPAPSPSLSHGPALLRCAPRPPAVRCPHAASLRAGIARAAGGIGIDSVGIYTAPDALSLHCTAATEAVEIG